ncbi:MAG: ATP-binding protein/SpoIIE family protein phosphatase [Polyangiaceae bacterium]
MTLHHRVIVSDSSDPGEARRFAVGIASQLGFDAADAGRVALVVTEASTNIIKHAAKGEILLRTMTATEGGPGIEVIALDRGPGMSDVASCFRDGFSTAGSSGTGLGAISRLTNEFELHTRPEGGTALWARIYPRGRRSFTPTDRMEIGAVRVAAPGESQCGDDWTLSHDEHGITLLVVDGLGHGPEAAKASAAAVRAFRSGRPPEIILGEVHLALQTTRGAAGSCAVVDLAAQSVTFAGVGNVAGSIVSQVGARNLVTQNGTLGAAHLGRIRAFDYPWIGGGCLVMWTDGLTSHTNTQGHPGLIARHPSLVAAVLYRDFVRGRDDATVVVVKETSARS